MPAGTIVVGCAFAGVIVKDPLPHIVAVWLGITGVGLTVTITVNVEPGQGAAVVGVIV